MDGAYFALSSARYLNRARALVDQEYAWMGMPLLLMLCDYPTPPHTKASNTK
jgi:hypothetical protein